MSENRISIAVAHSYVDADVKINGQNIRKQMTQTANAGCRLIQFTEAAVSGRFRDQITSWDEVDRDLLRSELAKIAAHAKKLNLWVVVGSNHHLTDPHLPYDSLYIISAAGDLVSRYDKRYISYNNIVSKKHSPGKIPITFEIDGIKFGCASGMEIWFNEVFEGYSNLGVECVLFSIYGADSSIYKITAQAQAAQHNIWIGFAADANNDQPVSSCFIGPNGSILEDIDFRVQGIAIGEVAPSDPLWDIPVNKARPWRKRAREGEIYRSNFVSDPRCDNRAQF